MKTCAITGASGYVGALLAEKLAADPACRVIGIDIKPPAWPGAATFRAADIRDPGIADLLHEEAVDVLIHLAFYTQPEGDARLAESVNIDGTANLLEAAAKARVGRLVLASSAAAYGSHADNPLPMTEASPLRPNSDFYYSWHKARQEALVQNFSQAHPAVQTVILRPSALIGPHINNPTGDSLRQKLLIYIRGNAAPLQFIHENDAIEAFRLAATGQAVGVYNVAAEGTITYPELAAIMGKRLLLLPYRLLAALASLGKALGVSPVSATTLRFIRHPMVVDGHLFCRVFGFRPRFDTRRTMTEFAASLNPHNAKGKQQCKPNPNPSIT